METKLSSFLHRAEWALLSLEPGSLGPKVDPDLRGPEGFDCTALQKLLEPTRGGELVTVLSDPWLEELSKVLSRQAVDAALAAGGLHRLVLDLTSASMSFLDAPSGSRPVRERALYMLGVVFLQHYMRANCTGPAKDEDDACLPFHPSASIEEGTPSAILGALEADGEPCYELLVCPGYLWLSALMFRLVPSEMPKFDGAALPFWRARCAFAWQLSLAEASERGCCQSPSLFRASVYELVSGEASPLSTKGFLEASALSAIQAATAPLLDTWKRSTERPPAVTPTITLPKAQESEETEVEGSDALEALLDVFEPPARAPASAEVPGAVRATVLVELANRLCWYSRLKIWEKSSDAACKAIGFHYELTGVMGIKREFQTTEFAQLVVRAKSQAAGKGIEVEESDAKKPETLSLKTVDDMTDVLEVPKLSKSVDEEVRLEIERPLTVTEQIILLSRCQYIWASSNPNDEMVLQEINALAQRVVKTQDKAREEEANEGPLFTANWLTFSCGLWYRCRAEHHRNKTRERAAFQLQSLVDQFADERPSAAHRLRTVHSAGYPARFHLQHEMATRMMRMGMMSTAHEQFKKLRMWPEAVECLICAERNVEAEDMVKDLIEKQPSPRLWCCLGDIVKDPAHYEKAWELSNRRFARAQRALGKYYFDKKQLDKAVESFKLALDINPMFEGIWFTLGVGLMQLERMEEAMIAFSRVLSINDEDGQAWANLAAVHLHQDRVKEARACMVEATRRCRQNWRMWESFMGICMKLRDIPGVIQALRRLVELGQMGRVKRSVLTLVTQAVIVDADGLYEGRTGRSCMRQLLDFYKFATDHTASRHDFWSQYANLQEAAGDVSGALESRLRESRALQARLWDENDPTVFSDLLQDLTGCLDLLNEILDDPAAKEASKAHVQPFAYLARDAAKRLKDRFDMTVQEPSWVGSVSHLQKIADNAEKRLAKLEG